MHLSINCVLEQSCRNVFRCTKKKSFNLHALLSITGYSAISLKSFLMHSLNRPKVGAYFVAGSGVRKLFEVQRAFDLFFSQIHLSTSLSHCFNWGRQPYK